MFLFECSGRLRFEVISAVLFSAQQRVVTSKRACNKNDLIFA